MPYSFIEIEKEKTWVIRAVFLFLVVLYFLIIELLWLITKAFFLVRSSDLLGSQMPALFNPIELLVVFFIAVILAYIQWYFSTKDMISKILTLLNAKQPDPKDTYHQVFKNVVEEVSVATGGQKINCCVVPATGMNAFAVSDFEGGAVIGVTEGLLARLNRSQLESVIGHEAAHVVSGDSFTTTVICSLFGIYSAILEGIKKVMIRTSDDKRNRAGGLGGRVGAYLAVVYVIISIAKGINYLLNMFISRQKEYRADATAVRLTRNPISLAEALHAISRGWRGVGEISSSLSPIFIVNPDYNLFEESEGAIADLFSTHPPVKSRLKILLDMAHADISALKEKKKIKVQVDEGIAGIAEEPQKEWLIYKDSSWQGPFSVEELFGLGLNPNSWISKIGEGFIKAASEDQLLNEALREKVTGVAPIKEDVLCPECREPLAEILYEGTPVPRCHYCGGILADNDVVTRIVAREDFAFSDSIKKLAEAILESYPEGIRLEDFKVVFCLDCPLCKEKMDRRFFSYAYPIEVDRCEKCQKVWFNKDELETLQYLIEKNRVRPI